MADEASLIVFRDAYYARFGTALDDRLADREGHRNSTDYWRDRESAERAAAKQAQTSAARAVHQELAQAYAARIQQLEAQIAIVSMRQR